MSNPSTASCFDEVYLIICKEFEPKFGKKLQMRKKIREKIALIWLYYRGLGVVLQILSRPYITGKTWFINV